MKIELLQNHDIHQVMIFIANHINQYQNDFTKIYFSSFNQEHFYYNQHHHIYLLKKDNQILSVIAFSIQDSQIFFLIGNHDNDKQILLDVALTLIPKSITIDIDQNEISFYQDHGFVCDNQNGMMMTICYHHQFQKQFYHYQEIEHYMQNQKNRVYSLNHFQDFMNHIYNPQLLLSTIHIGGTNGKGSTTNYLQSIFKEAGYKVATLTSPPLKSRLDIMQVQNMPIHEDEMVDLFNRYVDLFDCYHLSTFEIEVFIAIVYFLNQGVDIALFEVGLGGLLDATNIIQPLVALNTNIGFDHKDYLGDTYQSIAYNKAGIIKEGIDYITGEDKQVCLDVFLDVCHQHHSQLYQVQPVNHITRLEDGLAFDYRHLHIVLHTQAYYQAYNAALAVETILYLNHHYGFNITDEEIKEGCLQAFWPGRFEYVYHHPDVIIDGAHNLQGIDAFIESAKHYPNIKIIFSAFQDKETDQMLEKLLTLSDDITVCQFDHPRCAKAKVLAGDFPVCIEPDYQKAIENSLMHQGTVFITGSLHFIGLVRCYFSNKKNNNIS